MQEAHQPYSSISEDFQFELAKGLIRSYCSCKRVGYPPMDHQLRGSMRITSHKEEQRNLTAATTASITEGSRGVKPSGTAIDGKSFCATMAEMKRIASSCTTAICTETPGPHNYCHEHTSYPSYSSFCLVVYSCSIVAACPTTFVHTYQMN